MKTLSFFHCSLNSSLILTSEIKVFYTFHLKFLNIKYILKNHHLCIVTLGPKNSVKLGGKGGFSLISKM